MFYEILFVLIFCPCFHSSNAFSSASLNSIFTRGCSFHVTSMAKCDDHSFVRNEVLYPYFSFIRKDGATSRSSMFILNLNEFFFNYAKDPRFLIEDIHKILDFLNYLIVFTLHLLTFHCRELIKSQFKNRIYLSVGEDVLIAFDAGLISYKNSKRFGCFTREPISL